MFGLEALDEGREPRSLDLPNGQDQSLDPRRGDGQQRIQTHNNRICPFPLSLSFLSRSLFSLSFASLSKQRSDGAHVEERGMFTARASGEAASFGGSAVVERESRPVTPPTGYRIGKTRVVT